MNMNILIDRLIQDRPLYTFQAVAQGRQWGRCHTPGMCTGTEPSAAETEPSATSTEEAFEGFLISLEGVEVLGSSSG